MPDTPLDLDATDRPNPGSREAMAAGCICAVLDNNYGRFPDWPGWWITVGCPVHDGGDHA